MKVLFVGENIYKSKGGIVTVMDQILSDTYLQNNVTYIPIFTSGDGFNFFQKVFGWAKAIIKFAFNILQLCSVKNCINIYIIIQFLNTVVLVVRELIS